jgi:DivIVA domain-containing protein
VSKPAIELLFERALRGYDTAAVSALVAEVSPAVSSPDAQVRHRARERLRQVQLPVAMRGYHRRQVQDYLAWIAEQLTAPPSQQ